MKLTEDQTKPSAAVSDRSATRARAEKPPSALTTGYRKLFTVSTRQKLWRLRRRVFHTLNGQDLRFHFSGSCAVCGGKNLGGFSNRIIALLPFRFHTCRECGYIFVLPPKDLGTVYESHSIPDLGLEDWNNHYLTLINKHASRKGKLLEIGFGTASFLKLAHDDGWETYGADLSLPQIEHARDVLNLPNIVPGTIEEIAYPDNFFEVVAGFNFLEHVPAPRESLKEIRRILRPGGVLAIMCPNIAGLYHSLMPELLGDNDPLQITWVPPQHLSYFNKTNLRLLIDSCGFVIVEDASNLMSCLWQQFEPQIGAEETNRKLVELKADIAASVEPHGDAMTAKFRQRIKQLAIERMTWTMLTDLMELEPLLGAEVGTLLIAKKPEAD